MERFKETCKKITNIKAAFNLIRDKVNMTENNNDTERLDFVRQIVADDIAGYKCGKSVVTRFPPEPNGYLHIGHAKSICLNFGIAEEFSGKCNLRFDDTNPAKEDSEYVNAIIEDVKWLGWNWDKMLFASDYFEQMYLYAVELIKKGKAYVCDLSADETREYRGTLTRQGKSSPFRNRSAEENLELFEKMKNGEFADGEKTLKAKIDMASSNFNMRDPVMYRILHASHHRCSDKWCIYPMYDWAHGIEDSIEEVTHSICTLEFENHRPLYDWFLDELEIHHPKQIEFARLNLTCTVMSKRKLLKLVQEKFVNGWDDPRMPTLSGLRRRGYSPQAIRNFCKKISVNKFNSTLDLAMLEHCLRQNLNQTSPRVMAVLKPVKVVIDNYPKDKVEMLQALNNPQDEAAGTRKIPFSREIYIEADDFMLEPPKKFYRLTPGREVRLRYAYFITCTETVKDDDGNVIEIHCTYDPATRGGDSPDGRKVKSTIHWVSKQQAVDAEVRLYDNLFTKENPDEGDDDFTENISRDSLEILTNCKIEPYLKNAQPLSRWQFERLGYFCLDRDSEEDKLVFNRTVELRDTWAKNNPMNRKG